VGPGVPGLIFMNGPGDDGGMNNRAGGGIPQGGTNTVGIHKGDPGSLILNLWYGGADAVQVVVQTPAAAYAPFRALVDNNDYFSFADSNIAVYHYGAFVNSYGSTNGRRQLYLELNGPVGDYRVGLIGTSIANGQFDATLNPSQIWNTAANSNYFTSDLAPGNIWDGATAANNICSGDYVIRTNYTDVNGVPRFSGGEGGIGARWQGSSAGPTFDGRLGIDVCSPGDSVFTTYATNSYWETFAFNLIQDGGSRYGRASAVSAANPMAAGIVALLLELNPQLDALTAKSILQQSARADSFTGPTPNPRWGYGKVDAYQALILTAPAPNITSFAAAAGQFQISFSTTRGMNYRVDSLPRLGTPGWTTLTNGIAGTGGIMQANLRPPASAQSYYRVVMYP
jgi:hypothetical protein